VKYAVRLKDRRHPAAGHRQRTPGKPAAARPVLKDGLAIGITESAPEPLNVKDDSPLPLITSRPRQPRGVAAGPAGTRSGPPPVRVITGVGVLIGGFPGELDRRGQSHLSGLQVQPPTSGQQVTLYHPGQFLQVDRQRTQQRRRLDAQQPVELIALRS